MIKFNRLIFRSSYVSIDAMTKKKLMKRNSNRMRVSLRELSAGARQWKQTGELAFELPAEKKTAITTAEIGRDGYPTVSKGMGMLVSDECMCMTLK